MIIKNACKECGKSGYFLKLNKELLCPKCADEKNKRMTLEEVVKDLNDWFDGKGTLDRIEANNNRYNAKRKREDENFQKVYFSYQKARELEKKGKIDEALKIYLKNLKECPPGTDYYVRPCIILEKKHEYARAIEICDIAIKLCREGRFDLKKEGHFKSEDEFAYRKERLIKKLEKENRK